MAQGKDTFGCFQQSLPLQTFNYSERTQFKGQQFFPLIRRDKIFGFKTTKTGLAHEYYVMSILLYLLIGN